MRLSILRRGGTLVLAALLFAGCATQQGPGINMGAGSAENQRVKKQAELPHCPRPFGTVAIREPDTKWWQGLGLESPEALIKLFVMKSGCFTLVDRGRGFEMAQQERDLAAGGQLRGGSNIGGGQMKAADYIIVPDLVSKNRDASGSALTALAGALLPGIGGAIVASIKINQSTADVVLTVVDVRSSEQKAIEEGHASKTDVSFGGGAAFAGIGGFGAAGAGAYERTAIGQVVTTAYLDAYWKLIENDFHQLPTSASTANKPQALTAVTAGHLFEKPSAKSRSLRNLTPGAPLYPTGNKDGGWYEVKTELGELGWVARQVIGNAK